MATLHRARTKMDIGCKRMGYGPGSRILWFPTKPIDRNHGKMDGIDSVSGEGEEDGGGEPKEEVPF